MEELYKCLDHGYVKLIDIMGSDKRIVEAARISTDSKSRDAASDKNLIDYLMRNKHTSPFEMCEMVFEIKLPIFIARQWVRHRTANINEVSGRYTQLKTEYYTPNEWDLKSQSKINHQGSDEILERDTVYSVLELLKNVKNNFSDYQNLIDMGLSKEMARINLPLSTYTTWYWKNDLHNIFNFLKLRMDSHAQPEIQVYANAIAFYVKRYFPMAYQAFEKYILNSATFSEDELKIIIQSLDKQKVLDDIKNYNFGKSEIIDFKNKLKL